MTEARTYLDEEWDDIVPTITGKSLPVVQVRLTRMRGSRALCFITCRGEVAEWLQAQGPRFRAQIGGQEADRIRILPDASAGRFEAAECRGGTLRLNLGHMNVWPDEIRAPIECAYEVRSTRDLIVTLPKGWARPRPAAPAALPAPVARAVPAAARPIAPPVNLGEPPPGRSALDQRRAGKA